MEKKEMLLDKIEMKLNLLIVNVLITGATLGSFMVIDKINDDRNDTLSKKNKSLYQRIEKLEQESDYVPEKANVAYNEKNVMNRAVVYARNNKQQLRLLKAKINELELGYNRQESNTSYQGSKSIMNTINEKIFELRNKDGINGVISPVPKEIIFNSGLHYKNK